MHTIETATTATVASPKSALSWMAARTFFRTSRGGAQIRAAQLRRAARIALASVADPEARATLSDIVEDAGRVISLYSRAAR
jgi:hypothetical protein